MNDMEKSIVNEYEQIRGRKCKEYKTPVFPNEYLLKNEGDIEDLDNYRKMIGKMLMSCMREQRKLLKLLQ